MVVVEKHKQNKSTEKTNPHKKITSKSENKHANKHKTTPPPTTKPFHKIDISLHSLIA